MELCFGNRYTTSLHVINSAVVKLGKLQSAQKVYRGVSGGMLPAEFWEASDANVRGGCEFGFLSTTLEKEVASNYAASSGKAGILFEMQMGMIDRGASLGWLSQYPEEAEILFAPLSGLEVMGTRVQGAVLVVEVRLSINLNNATIEEVVAKMQSSALELLELVWDDFTFNGAPSRALEPLDVCERIYEHEDPEWFNLSENYERAVQTVLHSKEAVFHLLTDKSIWSEPGEADGGGRTPNPKSATLAEKSTGTAARKMSDTPTAMAVRPMADPDEIAKRQVKCASLAAREGHYACAAQLLRLTVESAPPSKVAAAAIEAGLRSAAEAVRNASETGELPWLSGPRQPSSSERPSTPPVEQWRLAAAHLLLSDLLVSPWPRTFVHLAVGSGSPTVLHACAAMACSHERLEVPRREVGSAVLVYIEEDWRWRIGIIAAKHESEADAKASALVTTSSPGLTSRNLVHSAAASPCKGTGLKDGWSFDVRVGKTLLRGLPSSRVFLRESGGGGVGAVLREAAGAGSAELVRALLSRGVSCYAASEDGSTALHFAARSGAEDVCRLLMAEGIDPRLDNAAQVSPYELSVSFHHAGVRRIFAPREAAADLTADATHGNELLRVCYSSQDDVEALNAALGGEEAAAIGKAAYVNHSVANGVTPLMVAAVSGNHLCLAALLNEGAQCELLSRNGCTALMFACRYMESEQIVTDLLKRGSSVAMNAATYEQGATALVYAAEAGHSASVRALLDAQADATLMMRNGETVLHQASHGGQTSIVEMLLELDEIAKPSMIDHKSTDTGMTALMMACDFGQTETAAMLLKAKAQIDLQDDDGETALFLAACDGQNSTIDMLLASGASVNLAANDGETCLMVACHYGHIQSVRLLLAHGASVQLADSEGQTALMALCLFNQPSDEKLIKMLIHASADLTDQMLKTGSTALHLAVDSEHPDAVAALLKAGADPERARDDGHTALSLACMHGYADILTLLLLWLKTTLAASVNRRLPLVRDRASGVVSSVVGSVVGSVMGSVVEGVVEGVVDGVEGVVGVAATAVGGAKPEGLTPLMLAAQFGAAGVVPLLLDAGASAPLGTRWVLVGAERPKKGQLLVSEALSTKLLKQTLLSEEELDELQLHDLNVDSFVKVSTTAGDECFDVYFQQAGVADAKATLQKSIKMAKQAEADGVHGASAVVRMLEHECSQQHTSPGRSVRGRSVKRGSYVPTLTTIRPNMHGINIT